MLCANKPAPVQGIGFFLPPGFLLNLEFQFLPGCSRAPCPFYPKINTQPVGFIRGEFTFQIKEERIVLLPGSGTTTKKMKEFHEAALGLEQLVPME